MPTGYTYGIVDGDTTTFEQFTKICMRAFLIHMRDENNDVEVYHREPSDYYTDRLNEAKKKLSDSESLSDSEIVQAVKDKLHERRIYCNKEIAKTSEALKRLNTILDKAENWTPPTDNHKKFKEFMIEQLELTILNDGRSDYYQKELVDIKAKMFNLNPQELRDQVKKGVDKDIKYNSKALKEDQARCDETNEWIDAILND